MLRISMNRIFGALALSALVGMPQAFAEGWDRVNSPTRLEPNFNYSFRAMPLSAEVPFDKMPWQDTYWPSMFGGIAYRWNSPNPAFRWITPTEARPNPRMFNYRSPSRTEVEHMTLEQLAQLSPSEKFDLVRGLYDYPLTKGEWGRVNPYDAPWEGICHGWAPASANHPEPASVVVANPQGIRIPFASADVKAILSFYYGTVNMNVRQLGKECNDPNPSNGSRRDRRRDRECFNDPNAGSFHIVMANYIGLRQQPFVAELGGGIGLPGLERTNPADGYHPEEVWNYAVYDYSSRVLDRSGPVAGSAEGTVSRVKVETKISYPDDDQAPIAQPTVGTPGYKFLQDTYRYWIELDRNGNIIGGEWASAERPDYLWMKNRMSFSGDFAALSQVYRPAALPANPVRPGTPAPQPEAPSTIEEAPAPSVEAP